MSAIGKTTGFDGCQAIPQAVRPGNLPDPCVRDIQCYHRRLRPGSACLSGGRDRRIQRHPRLAYHESRLVLHDLGEPRRDLLSLHRRIASGTCPAGRPGRETGIYERDLAGHALCGRCRHRSSFFRGGGAGLLFQEPAAGHRPRDRFGRHRRHCRDDVSLGTARLGDLRRCGSRAGVLCVQPGIAADDPIGVPYPDRRPRLGLAGARHRHLCHFLRDCSGWRRPWDWASSR